MVLTLGVVGSSKGNIANSYTLGRIKAYGDDKTGVTRVGGFSTSGPNTLNCYYSENNIEIIGDGVKLQNTGEAKTELEMKSPDFVEKLNEGQEDKPWKQDTNNINNGYPILSWQGE